jgi:micrococcal nuclease
VLAAVAALTLLAGCSEPRTGSDEDAATPPTSGSVEVASVTDGDTIRLRGGERVRLVQIDAPEVRDGAECGGRAATRALEGQLPRGTRVRLVADPATDRVDDYGRLLRYVYVGERNLNVWLVEQGHAVPFFFRGERGRFARQLERAERDARAAGRGTWGACTRGG